MNKKLHTYVRKTIRQPKFMIIYVSSKFLKRNELNLLVKMASYIRGKVVLKVFTAYGDAVGFHGS